MQARGAGRVGAGFAVVALLVGAWLVAALVLGLAYGDRVLPGVRVAGVAAGGADAAELEARLRDVEAPERKVVVAGAGQRFRVTGVQLRLRVDRGRTVRRALDDGRGGLLKNLAAPMRVIGGDRELEPVYALDADTVERVAATIAGRVDRRPSRGGLVVEAEASTVRARPPRSGRVVDRAALRRSIKAAMQRGSQRVVLPVRERPGPSRAAVDRVAARASAYMQAAPLRLSAGGRTEELDAEAIGALLDVEGVPGSDGTGVRLGVDTTAAKTAIDQLADRYDRDPLDAGVDAAAAPVLFETQGSVRWRPRSAAVTVRDARAGRAVRRDGAVRRIAAAIRGGRHEVELPVARIAPDVDTASVERVTDLIGTFTTRYACCQPRATNIRLIAEAVDGTVVEPGEQFSLNGAAGPRTRERGFLPAPFIADGELVDSVGGGVSQFSTTMYNAAYFAGLQLDSSQPHSFYIERYPPGREATLDYDSIDLTWTNDTDAPVLVRASTTDTSVAVSLYGDNGDRRVRSDVGSRSNVPDRDFSITVTRTVRYPDGRVAQLPRTTTYDRPPDE